MTAMLVHDTRLIGNTPNLAPNVYRVGGTTPLRHAFGWIATYAKSQQGLDRLTIMCHGMAAAFHDGAARESASDLGYRLLFCRERLPLRNINVTAIVRGLVQEIELLACGPARTRPGAENTAADGCGSAANLQRTRMLLSSLQRRPNTTKRPGALTKLILAPGKVPL